MEKNRKFFGNIENDHNFEGINFVFEVFIGLQFLKNYEIILNFSYILIKKFV